jgi:hypothetical protein
VKRAGHQRDSLPGQPRVSKAQLEQLNRRSFEGRFNRANDRRSGLGLDDEKRAGGFPARTERRVKECRMIAIVSFWVKRESSFR